MVRVAALPAALALARAFTRSPAAHQLDGAEEWRCSDCGPFKCGLCRGEDGSVLCVRCGGYFHARCLKRRGHWAQPLGTSICPPCAKLVSLTRILATRRLDPRLGRMPAPAGEKHGERSLLQLMLQKARPGAVHSAALDRKRVAEATSEVLGQPSAVPAHALQRYEAAPDRSTEWVRADRGFLAEDMQCLVQWTTLSRRHATWVTVPALREAAPARLRNFLTDSEVRARPAGRVARLCLTHAAASRSPPVATSPAAATSARETPRCVPLLTRLPCPSLP